MSVLRFLNSLEQRDDIGRRVEIDERDDTLAIHRGNTTVVKLNRHTLVLIVVLCTETDK